MNIIITGASRGIGFATAVAFAEAGHQVLALSRNESALEDLVNKAPQQITSLGFDLSAPDWSALRLKIEAFGGCDVLLHNAGYLVNKPFAELETTDWEQSLAVNLLGPAQLTQFLLPWLRQSKSAHVVNISSMGGYQGSSKFPGLAAYSASKGGLSILTECLATELAEDGIAVNCLALGAVQTEMLAAAFPGYQAPLSSEQMGDFLLWFGTTGHQFFNGKILPVALSNP